jgi:meso-butanediol dehydrogenase/(S,S)-butanediol dehydrogenase/diacetyl reductase
VSAADRVVFVTGGSSGIGKATAAAFLADGYAVGTCARNPEHLADAARELDPGDRLLAVPADVAERGQAAAAIARTVERFGRLDALVNAHGVIGGFEAIEQLTPRGWDEVLGANLHGPINTTSEALPHLKTTRGAIVNVSSINAYQAEPLMAPYGVAKAGLVAFTAYAACEFAEFGIRVNCIAPGWVSTPMAQPFFDESGLDGTRVGMTMLGRIGEPEEIASIAVFLAGPGASYMTGTTVVADGGQWPLLAPIRAKEP